MEKVELGDKVRDKVSGWEGVVTQYAKCLTGCDRVLIQGPVTKDGKIGEGYYVDAFACEVIKKGAVKINTPGVNDNGGPHVLARRQ